MNESIFKKSKEKLNVNIFTLKNYKYLSDIFHGICEGITDSLDAVQKRKGNHPKKIVARIIKGSEYPDLLEPDEYYFVIIDSGVGVSDFKQYLDNGNGGLRIEENDRTNHVLGIGIKILLAQLTDKNEDYLVLTRLNEAIKPRFVTGPYCINPSWGTIEKSWDELGLPEWARTALFVHIDDESYLDEFGTFKDGPEENKMYKRLCEKYSGVLNPRKNTRGKRVEIWFAPSPDDELVELKSVSLPNEYNKNKDSSWIAQTNKRTKGLIYEIEHFYGKGTSDTTGYYIGVNGILIKHYSVNEIVAKTNKISLVETFSEKDGLKTHPVQTPHSVVVNITFDESVPYDETFQLPFKADKSGFVDSERNWKILRKAIDELTGDFFRKITDDATEKEAKMATVHFIKKLFKPKKGFAVLLEPRIGTKEDWSGEEPDRPDLVIVKVQTEAMRTALKKYYEELKTNHNAQFELTKEMFPWTEEEMLSSNILDDLRVIEFKNLFKKKNKSSVLQACSYADEFEMILGVPSQMVQLYVMGSSLDSKASKVMNFMRDKRGYDIEFNYLLKEVVMEEWKEANKPYFNSAFLV